jgi:hypothetical protein
MAIVERISAALNANLGRCPICTRQSLFLMLGTWGLVDVMTSVTMSPLVLTLTRVIAVGATGLWLSHLTAFVLRAMRNANTLRSNTIARYAVTNLPLQPRRQFVLALSKSFLLAAAAGALPIGAVFAQSKMQQCLSCCASRLSACGTSGSCNTLYQNCVASCNSQGASPSDWKCW